MTVSTTDNRIPYSGNGVTTVFDFPYKFLATSDLKVYVDDELMTLTTDYSVGTPSDDGASVTFVVAPASGTNNIVILRDPDLLQQSALPSNGPFPSTTVETMVDKGILIVQRLSELIGRSFRLPDSDISGASTELPTPAASNIIGWDVDGLALQNYTAEDFATIATAGNYRLDKFSGDGVTTAFVLSGSPGSINNTQINVGGVYQLKSDYSLAGSTITFDTAPPAGTDNIEVLTAGAVAINQPSDASVSTAQLADGALAATVAGLAKMADGFLAATAAGRAKMADLFVTTEKLADNVFSGLTNANAALSTDSLAGSSGVSKRRFTISNILGLGAMVQDFRLSLTTAVSVTTSDVTAAGTIYAVPYKGNLISLYNGAGVWTLYESAQMSIAVPAVANQMYDVFCYDNAGTPTLELTAWTNDTTRATALTTVEGVLVKTGATTRRYLGSFRTLTASQTEDSNTKRLLFNYYHRVLRRMFVRDATASWSYSTNVYQQANASAANQLAICIGVADTCVTASLGHRASSSTATVRSVNCGIGVDSTTVNSSTMNPTQQVASTRTDILFARLNGYISEGYHTITWLERGAGTDTQTWYGGNETGLQGEIFA